MSRTMRLHSVKFKNPYPKEGKEIDAQLELLDWLDFAYQCYLTGPFITDAKYYPSYNTPWGK